MSNTTDRMARVFDEAIRVTAEKNAKYNDAWRHQGWRGNLSRILEKSARLRNMLWRPGDVLLNGEKEHPRETAIDMINTLTFMVLNMDEGREWGHEAIPASREEWQAAAGRAWSPENNSLIDEQTSIQPHVGETENPFELGDPPVAPTPPSPQPRRGGSGPRKVKDAPQA